MTTTNEMTTSEMEAEQLIYSADHQQQDQQLYEDEYDTIDAIPQILDLDLRGTRIQLDRETLVSLPENLLIAMFPNGLVIGRPESRSGSSSSSSSSGSSISSTSHEEEQEVLTTYVDLNPDCLRYVLDFYQYAVREKCNSIIPQQSIDQYYPLLVDKQPIVVLREELEYYCISANVSTKLKLASGNYLKDENKIFLALEKNVERENNIAEQHLITMLCDAGFTRQDLWKHRELEPSKTMIISMTLVLLNTISHMQTAQKLFLFWRKPARKCWWEGNTIEINNEKIRLWSRRTWTLELALI